MLSVFLFDPHNNRESETIQYKFTLIKLSSEIMAKWLSSLNKQKLLYCEEELDTVMKTHALPQI